jgi:hypothetical protein
MPKDRRDIDQGLRNKGFRREQGGRDHDFYFFEYKGLVAPVYTKLSRGSSYRTIGDNLIGKISRQLHLTTRQFNDLVDCTMSQRAYESCLAGQGKIP